MMTDKQRIEWLASLKVGDKVLIEENNIGFVEKITPKRFFNIKVYDNIIRYNQDGCYSYDEWKNDYIHPWTIEDEKRIYRKNKHNSYIKEVTGINWEKIKFSQLERIINILREK